MFDAVEEDEVTYNLDNLDGARSRAEGARRRAQLSLQEKETEVARPLTTDH